MKEHGFVAAFKAAVAVEGLSVRKAASLISSSVKISRRRIEAVCYLEMPLTFDTFILMREGAAKIGIQIRYDAVDFYNEQRIYYGLA